MLILRTGDVPEPALDAFVTALPGELRGEISPSTYMFKSSDPPSWIKLAGDFSFWQQALGAAAALYVAELVKEIAKESWRKRAEIIAKVAAAGSAVKRLAQDIAKLKSEIEPRTDVILCIPIPDEFFGTVLRISASEPDLAELEIALFTHHMARLEQLLTGHSSQNFQPATGYFLALLDNGDLQVEWFHPVSLQKQSVTLPMCK